MELRIDVRGGGSGDKAFSMLTERWLRGPERRRRFLEPLREVIEGRAPKLEEEDVLLAAGPALSVLKQGMDGIGLTATGAYKIGFVRQMAREHPRWAQCEKPEELHREADLPMLRDLRAIIEDCGFTHVDKGLAFTSDNAAEMMEQTPTGLLMALGCEIVSDHGFPSQAGELCAAAVLHGERLDPDALTERIQPVLAEFCCSGEESLNVEATRLAVTLWLDMTASVGVVPDPYLEELRPNGAEPGSDRRDTDPGMHRTVADPDPNARPLPAGEVTRACMIAMLRFRVLCSTVLSG